MIDLDAMVLGPTFDSFAQPATFIPAAGGTITTYGGTNIGRGVFDNGYSPLNDLGGDTPTATVDPTLGVRLSEFSTAPVENDKVYIPSVDITYMVKLVRPDGHGHARLMLGRTA